jgi:hypothetical protein
MRPRVDSPGLGLGLALIAAVCEQMEVLDRRERPGVALRMHFRLFECSETPEEGSGSSVDGA